MIIWTRWGILVPLALALSAFLGNQTLTGLGLPSKGPLVGVAMFGYATLVSLALTLWVFPRLDKPQPAMLERVLAEPIVDEKGRKKTTEIVQAVDDEGNGLFVTPRSTLFFIPVRFYWIVFAVVAVVATIQWIFTR
ncbi:hypothetical protein ACIQTT_13685 [Microbacterium sp. NPDC090225]|uniref:hypothetical protein n=1 Tax=Microbacterium sp. NPDC090225 TaxID=3364207 RepID=UPI0037FE406E